MPLRTYECVMSVPGPSNGLIFCNYCDYQTKTHTGIRLHMKVKHKKNVVVPKARTCNNCGKIFNTEKEVAAHHKTEHWSHPRGKR